MIENLIPPSRYENCRFSNYYPDEAFPSQELARNRLIHIVEKQKRQRSWVPFFSKGKNFGLYLDGSFGVGKTHLLASFYNEYPSEHKIYLSFTDLMAIISHYGIEKTVDLLKSTKLICIDEFELDDPANTMKVANFLRRVFASSASVVTTSNTVADELGKGRFAYENFMNEIGFISKRFEQIRIEGSDYRQQGKDSDFFSIIPAPKESEDLNKIDFNSLKMKLESLAFIAYSSFVQEHKIWFIEDVEAFKVQDHAIRFAYFIDKVYDTNVRLSLRFKDENPILFIDEFLYGSYEKKYKRCLSRLHELTSNFSKT